MLSVVIFLLTLLVLVLSHELGHFLMAKKFKVKVLEFGFGIPPKIWGRKVGETLVSLNLLPIGGFVRLLGEDETEGKILQDKQSLRSNDLKKSFAVKKVRERVAIVTAGVLMNFILATVIFWLVLLSQGFKEQIPLLASFKFFGVNQTNETVILIGKVAPDSPAGKAQISPGDRVIKLNDIKLESSDQLIGLTQKYGGEKITLSLLDPQDKLKIVDIVPRENPPQGQGPLGVELGNLTLANLNYQSPLQKIFSGPAHAYNLGSYSLVLLGQLIGRSFAEQNFTPVSESLSGPVGITNVSAMILQTKNPFIPYLNFMGLLSLNLAIINILPFPALDGGRLFFLMIEAFFGRKVKPEIERFIHTLGMAFLVALIILVTFSDIRKLFF